MVPSHHSSRGEHTVLYADNSEREERSNGLVNANGSRTGGEGIGADGGRIAVIVCDRALIVVARALLDTRGGTVVEDPAVAVPVVPDTLVVGGVVPVALIVGRIVPVVFADLIVGGIVPVVSVTCVIGGIVPVVPAACVVGGVVVVVPAAAAPTITAALFVGMII